MAASPAQPGLLATLLQEMKSTQGASYDERFLKAIEELDAPVIRALAAVDAKRAGELSRWDYLSTYPQTHAARALISPPYSYSYDPNGAADLWARGERWVQTLEAVTKLEFEVFPEMLRSWLANAISHNASPAQIEWMIGSEAFKSAPLSRHQVGFVGNHGNDGLVQLLRAEGPAELAMLSRWVEAGLAGGDDRCVNPTDFAVAGQWKNAQALVDMGFAPGQGAPIPCARQEAIPALLASFSPRGSERRRKPGLRTPEAEAAEAAGMLADLDRFIAMGATLNLSTQDRPENHAFFALLAGGAFSNERAPTFAMIEALTPRLLAMGADPSAGGWTLARCIDMERNESEWGCHTQASNAWDWALSVGANPAAYPGKIFSYLAGMRDQAKALALIDKIAAAGGDPSTLARNDPEAPLHLALEAGCLPIFWKLVGMGAPLNYVDPEGETAAHLLAISPDKKKTALLATILARPEMTPMIEAASSSSGRQGERPLHRACAGLSLSSMTLLLDLGADPNARDAKGWTPLRHLLRKFGASAQKKIEPCLRLLLERGADPSIADNKGRTPAQAVAGKAPMAALEELLRLRPEDVASESAQSLQAKKSLGERGGHGRSLVEKIELDSVAGEAPTKDPESRPARKRRL